MQICIPKHRSYTDPRFINDTFRHDSRQDVSTKPGNSASPAACAAWYWLAQFDDKGLADKSIGILSGSLEAMTTSPFNKCRESLMNSRANKRKLTNDAQLKLLWSAWEKAKAGKTVKALRPVKQIACCDAAYYALKRIRDR